MKCNDCILLRNQDQFESYFGTFDFEKSIVEDILALVVEESKEDAEEGKHLEKDMDPEGDKVFEG